ncbi:hypothetical protein KDK95_02440 [Actinospica sp. MGRD01-02]|uniref:Outer membrane channel protein CpnT-like N-terminal domain-containing protein n=1 Tax=Actinospica acidithermotolerans TaxID=2828514 RepID=A0A941IFK5_9ACTN|nr:hypothetical protein [Actinospica acidithermotolerans]MBR7825149.1 hypothetical protein [Actinospica acidithermotolerans]
MNIDGVDISLDNLTQDLLELLVGERWPNGDEGAMRSLASAWTDAASQLDEIRQTASAAAQRVGEYCQGANADALKSFWSANFDDGQTSWPAGVAPAALPFAVQFCKAMASALTAGANQIETTKDMIMGNIAILVATVTPQIAAGFFDFGATDATAVAEVLADRTVMQALLDGAKDLIVEMVEQAIEQGLMQAELAFVIQFKEVMEGHAGSIDWGQVEQAGISGAEGGAMGAAFGFGIGKAGGRIFGEDFGKSFAGRAAAGVASGGLTNAGLDLLQNGKISASDFAKGSLAGVLGGMGGAEAAAGEKPAIDTENLPTELDTPNVRTPDLTAPQATDVPTVDAGARTDLSGLAMPTADHGTPAGLDNTALGADTPGTGTPVRADLSGGVSVDPSQAAVAASSVGHILGGGTTENAGAGMSTSSGFSESPAATTSATASGSAPAETRGFQEPTSLGGIRSTDAMPTSARSDLATSGGSGGLGSVSEPPASARADSASSGGSGSGYAQGGESPTSARLDTGATTTSGAAVSDLGAGASVGSRADSPGAGDAGISAPGDTASSGRQYSDSSTGDPVSGGLPLTEGGSMLGGASAVRDGGAESSFSGGARADSGLGDAAGRGAGPGDSSTGAGGGSSPGRFYGGRGSVLDRTGTSAGSADRSTIPDAESTATSPDALNLTERQNADRFASSTSEPGMVDPATRESVADPTSGDSAVTPSRARDDISAQAQEPRDAVTPSDPTGFEHATDPSGSGQGADTARSEYTADPSGSDHAADPTGSEHATDPSGSGQGADPARSEYTADPSGSDHAADPTGSEHAAEPADGTVSAGGTVTADDSGAHESQSDDAAAAASEQAGPLADGSHPDTTGPEQPDQPERTAEPEPSALPSDPATWADGAEPVASARDVTQPESTPSSDAGAKPEAAMSSDTSAKSDTVASKPDSGKPDASGPGASKPDAARSDAPGNAADRGVPDARGQEQPQPSSDGAGRRDGQDGAGGPAPNAGNDAAVLIPNQVGGPVHDPSAETTAWAPPNQAGGLSDRLAQVNSRAQAGDRGISMFSDPEMAALAGRVEPDPNGAFDLNLHGDATGGVSGLERLSPQDLLDLANANGHRPGQPFRLTSCEAGALDHGFAAELSRISGCKVIAADSLVWTDSAGHMFASGSHVDGFGESVPDIPPSGRWVEFSPDGTKLPVGENGFPPGQESGFGGWNSPVGDVRARAADIAQWNPPSTERTLKVPDDSEPALRPLAPGERFADRSDLPASAKINVVDTNGEPRGAFYTDANGKITHAELPVPNTRHGQEQTPPNPGPTYQRHGLSEQNVIDGSNPDAATPPGDATVKYTWNDRSAVFKTDAEGEPQPPAVWDSKFDPSTPPKDTFKLGPRKSVFSIKPGSLEPGTHYRAEQTPRGESTPRITDFWTDGSGKIVAVDTWRGRDSPASADDGGWNPNLGAYGQAKGPDGMRFQPGVTFRVDGKVGVTDGFGRMTGMSLDHGAEIADPLNPSVRNESAQGESNSFGKAEYPAGSWDGGHKYPAAVGGPSEPFNYFPQDRDSNQGNGADAEGSWWMDEMDTVAAVKYQEATVSGWDIIESHDTGTPGDPTADPPTPPAFNKTPENVIVRKTYRFPRPDGTPGPPRTTIRFTTNVQP